MESRYPGQEGKPRMGRKGWPWAGWRSDKRLAQFTRVTCAGPEEECLVPKMSTVEAHRRHAAPAVVSARGKDRAGREAALLTRGVNLLDPVAHVTRKHHVALHIAAHKEIFLHASLRYLLCGLRQVGRTLV